MNSRQKLVEFDIELFMGNDPDDKPAIKLLNPKEPGAFLGTGMQLTRYPLLSSLALPNHQQEVS